MAGPFSRLFVEHSSALAYGQSVRLRFVMKDADVYALQFIP